MWIETRWFQIGTVAFTLLLGVTESRSDDMLPLIGEDDLPSKVEQMAGSENAELPVILGPLAEPPAEFPAEPRSEFSAAGSNGNGLKSLQPLPEDATPPGLDREALLGARLLDSEGRPSGRIEALLGDDSGTPLAVLAHSGGFLGLGGHRFLVPLTALDLDAADGETVPSSISRSQIALLPSPPADDD